MRPQKMEKEIKIFSGKGNADPSIKNTLISVGSNLNKELEKKSSKNNNVDSLTQKVNKKRIKKETSLKEIRSPTKLKSYYFKNNFSPKKNTLSINGNYSKNNKRPSIAERSSFFEQGSVIESSNSNNMSHLQGNEGKSEYYSNSQTKSSNISSVNEIEEDEEKEGESSNENKTSTSNNSEWSKKFKDKLFDKLKKIVKKVEKKKKNDYNYIISAIQDNDDEEVLNILTDNNFKKFYRNNDNLFEKDIFMDELVKYRKFELIKKITIDPLYEFNNDYIFDCLLYCIHPNKGKKEIICNSFDHDYFNNASNIGESVEKFLVGKIKKIFFTIKDDVMLEIISGLVENNLYDSTEQKKIRIITWFLALLGLDKALEIIIKENEGSFSHKNQTEKALNFFINSFNELKQKKDILTFSIKYYIKTIEDCLSIGLEDLAILIASLKKPYPELIETYKTAAKYESMMYLKFIWEKAISYNRKYKKKASDLSNKLKNEKNFSKNMTKNTNIDISEVINILIKNHKDNKYDKDFNNKIKKIFEWKNIEQQPSLLKSLFDNNCFEHICFFLNQWPDDEINKEEYFKKSIEFKQKELILYYLTKKEIRNILHNKKIQEILINEYIANGELFYYGAECLSYIYKKKWDINLTKNLCKNITKTINTKDILNCHSPLLSCLLLLEFIRHIQYLSSLDINKCEKVINLLIEFCQSAQETIHDESSISYLMKQKDTRERTVFQIVSDNHLYQLLETPEIGIVIKKMWNGVLNSNGIKNTSSLYRFLFNYKKLTNPYTSFKELNPNKVYFFQLTSKLDGCSSRVNEIGLFSIILALVYNIYIYILNEKDEVLNNLEEVSVEAKIFLYIYLILVHIIIYNLFLETIFLYLTNRKLRLGVWGYLDLLLYIAAWFCILDTKRFTGEYRDDNIAESAKDLIWSIQVPILNNLQIEDPSLSTQMSFWIRISILSVNDLIVWSRVTGVFLKYRELGPVIRMVFTMGRILFKYIFILIFFMACCAGIFTCIFNRHSEQFKDFSTSVISLFGAFLNTFDCYGFDRNYQAAGSIILLIYVCIASVLFINLLIAIISNGFQEINKIIESSHRAALINHCKKFKWDKKFGYLIFLSPPFNLITFPVLIINYVCQKVFNSFKLKDNFMAQKKFNVYATRLFFILIYFPFYILEFTLFSICLIPFVYIKGIKEMVSYLANTKLTTIFKYYYFVRWLLLGILYLVYIIIRDIYLCFIYMFIEIERKDDEFLRMTKNLTDQDVINIFKFIHSQKAMESRNDVHSMFMAYLDFEKEELGEPKPNQDLKRENTIGTSKLGKVGTKIVKRDTKLDNPQNNKLTKSILIQNDDTDMTTKIRKNLMVIETLENFAINDDNITQSSVNVIKMRKILPLVYNVKKKHFNRLVYSHVSILGGMSKSKENKNNFRRYLLTKQIIDYAINIDKQIDIEINKLQRKIIEGKKNLNSSKVSPINRLRSTFMLNNKGKLIDDIQQKDKEDKKNIVVELRNVQDFHLLIEKLMIENNLIIKNKNNDI